jgi:hypothetical protein
VEEKTARRYFDEDAHVCRDQLAKATFTDETALATRHSESPGRLVEAVVTVACT